MAQRSDVWSVFELVKDQKKAKCTLCLRELAYHGGTTSLRKHIETCHAIEFAKLRKESADSKEHAKPASLKKHSSIDAYVRRMTCSESRAGELTDAIVDMIALDLRPISSASGVGFRRLMYKAEPSYRVPSATTISTLLRRKHDEGLVRLKEMLQCAPYVALSTDMWTSRAMDGYITVTSHRISTEWKLMSLVLATAGFVENHTAEEIGKRLVKIAESQGVAARVAAVVHDEAANQCAALRKAKEVAQEDYPDSSWESIVCAAHRLQTCLKYALAGDDEIQEMIKAARKLVGHFRHSCKATTALKAAQQDKRIPKKVIQDVVTRWNSTYYMLQRLVELHSPIVTVLSDKKVSKRDDLKLDMTASQWALAEDLVKALWPFEVATTLLSAEYNVSLSCVAPIMAKLAKCVRELADDSPSIACFKDIAREQLQTRFNLLDVDSASLANIASGVDPRFKQLKFLPSDAVPAVRYALLALMKNVDKASTGTAGQGKQAHQPTAEPQAKKPRSAWDILESSESEDDEKRQEESAEEELRRFVALDCLPRNADPLLFWKLKEDHFRRLSKVAKSLLCIPATSTPAERIFSAGGVVASQLRASIKPENLDALIFLNKNMATLFNMKPLGQDAGAIVKAEPMEGLPGPSASAQASAQLHDEDPDLPSLVPNDIQASWED